MKAEGTARLWFFFDVGDRIRVNDLTWPGGEGMRPAVETVPDPDTRVLFYECGVIGVEYRWSFSLEWPDLVASAAQWVTANGKEAAARLQMLRSLEKIKSALERPYDDLLSEEYLVLQVENRDAAGLLDAHASEIASILRGESQPLSQGETAEALKAAISYFPDDLVVSGWACALVCGGKDTTIDHLAYANVQLLEFRHYDAQLTDVLASAYGDVRRWHRWSLRSKAQYLNGLLIDIRESTERMDNAVKFLSDTYAARLYRLAAQRIGVDGYRRLVEEKYATAREVYQFMIDQFHHTRAFVLEAMVVVILLIELYYLLSGKR